MGQLLESIPDVVMTVHSGEAKPNQYLLRGFKSRYGTDIANFVADVPINRSRNAHGRGYSDLNFLMPKLLGGLDYTKGIYTASVSDFGEVASAICGSPPLEAIQPHNPSQPRASWWRNSAEQIRDQLWDR